MVMPLGPDWSCDGDGRAAHRPGGRALDARRGGGIAQGAPQDRRAVADSERAAEEAAASVAPRRRRHLDQGAGGVSAYRPKTGTIEIDRLIPPLGRVRLRTGTHDARRAEGFERMLDVLPLDVVRLIVDRDVTLREVYDLWSQGKPLPSADELRPLLPTLEAWLARPLKAVGDSEQRAREAFVERIRALARPKAGLRAFPGLWRALYLSDQAAAIGAGWNRRHAAALAFLRDVVGRRTELYRQVADLPHLPEIPKQQRHPCTVAEAR